MSITGLGSGISPLQQQNAQKKVQGTPTLQVSLPGTIQMTSVSTTLFGPEQMATLLPTSMLTQGQVGSPAADTSEVINALKAQVQLLKKDRNAVRTQLRRIPRSTANLENNEKVTQRIQKLIQGDPTISEMLKVVIDNPPSPNSPDAQVLNARLDATWKGSKEDLKELKLLLSAKRINMDYQGIKAQIKTLKEQTPPTPIDPPSTGEPIKPNYADNQSIGKRMLQLGKGDPQIESLMTQLVNAEPESPEAQQLQAAISAQWKGSPEDLKEVKILGAVRQTNNALASLNSQLSNLEPGSPEAQRASAAIDSIKARRQTLIDQIENPPVIEPPQNGVDYTNNQSIGNRMLQLGQGDPQIESLMTRLVNAEPESPEAQQLQAAISAQWKGSPEDLKEVKILGAVRQTNNALASLNSQLSNLEPGSPDAQRVSAAIDSIKARRQTLIDQIENPSVPQEPIKPNYADNNSIAQRMQQLGQGDPQIESLMSQLVNVEPESPEAQMLQARISAQWKGSPEELEEVQKLSAVRQLNNMLAALNNIGSNLEPGSVQALQLRARIGAISAQRQTLIDQLEYPATQKEPIKPDYANNGSIAQRMLQIGKSDPQIESLMSQLVNVEPESPEAQILQARISALWKGSPEDLKEVKILGAVRQTNNALASLNSQLSNLEPGSPDAQRVSAAIDSIKARRQTLIDQLQ